MASLAYSEPAEYDLIELEHYIYVVLCNPQAADNVISGIARTIDMLESFPKANPVVSDELLRNLDLRIAYYDNYNIFYVYLESSDIVYIMRVLYNKSDWKNILLDDLA